MPRAHIRVIAAALEVAGNPASLAEALEVTIPELRRWYDGEEEIPPRVFIRLIDIVSNGRLPLAVVSQLGPSA